MSDLILPLAFAFLALLSFTPLLFEHSNPKELEEMGIVLKKSFCLIRAIKKRTAISWWLSFT